MLAPELLPSRHCWIFSSYPSTLAAVESRVDDSCAAVGHVTHFVSFPRPGLYCPDVFNVVVITPYTCNIVVEVNFRLLQV